MIAENKESSIRNSKMLAKMKETFHIKCHFNLEEL